MPIENLCQTAEDLVYTLLRGGYGFAEGTDEVEADFDLSVNETPNGPVIIHVKAAAEPAARILGRGNQTLNALQKAFFSMMVARAGGWLDRQVFINVNGIRPEVASDRNRQPKESNGAPPSEKPKPPIVIVIVPAGTIVETRTQV